MTKEETPGPAAALSKQAETIAHFKPPKGRPYAVVINGERVLISSVPKDGRPGILVEVEQIKETA